MPNLSGNASEMPIPIIVEPPVLAPFGPCCEHIIDLLLRHMSYAEIALTLEPSGYPSMLEITTSMKHGLIKALGDLKLSLSCSNCFFNKGSWFPLKKSPHVWPELMQQLQYLELDILQLDVESLTWIDADFLIEFGKRFGRIKKEHSGRKAGPGCILPRGRTDSFPLSSGMGPSKLSLEELLDLELNDETAVTPRLKELKKELEERLRALH